MKSLITALAILLATPLVSFAIPYQFNPITNNTTDDLSGQLLVDVTNDGNLVSFTFTNNVGIASSITDIYFDLSGSTSLVPLMTYSGMLQSSGVSFALGATPPNLPGGNTIGFLADFGVDSNSPVSQNGINTALEYLTIKFNSVSYGDVYSALDTGALRIGLHVQSIGNTGRSDSYATAPVPEPTTMLLFGTGLVALAGIGRRRQ